MSDTRFPARRQIIHTSHGSIAVEERGEQGPPVLFIHGNSFCRAVFDAQLQSSLADDHRLIAIDLPGHGESTDASDPMRSYTLPGFAEAAAEVLQQLDASEAVVVGWSLGGHIGVELVARSRGFRGLMIIGAPPIPANGWALGFRHGPHSALAAQQDWSVQDRDAFLVKVFGRLPEPRLCEAAARADGRFRKRVFQAAREGAGVDQKLAVETHPAPLAVVNGAGDSLINLDYLDSIAYANLWEGRCHRLDGLGHAPFWEAPLVFTPLLARFLKHCSAYRCGLTFVTRSK